MIKFNKNYLGILKRKIKYFPLVLYSKKKKKQNMKVPSTQKWLIFKEMEAIITLQSLYITYLYQMIVLCPTNSPPFMSQ